MEKYIITDREPQKLYHFFEDLAAIPRVTFHEKRASDYVADFAKSRGFWYYQDEMYNILVKKPGSKGCEALPPVLFESHLDMVAAKEEWSLHDFETEGIELIEEGNILRANGTTLGADNGCGVSLMLALLDDEELVHPPLECLFTVQEETGLDGAKAFDLQYVKARRVIGLDAGEEGVFRMGTTTKVLMNWAFPVKREKLLGTVFEITVDGLRGGTQGEGVPKERICAIKMLCRVLHFMNKEMDVRVLRIHRIGTGIADNCTAQVALVSGDEEKMSRILKQQQALIRREYQGSDPDIRIQMNKAETQDVYMLEKSSGIQLIDSIYLSPYGVKNRNPLQRNEVTCSVAIRQIYTEEDAVRIYAVISADEREQREEMREEFYTYFSSWEWKKEEESLERGWEKEEHSPIRETMVRSYVEVFGREPVVNVSHGGNDCVVLKHRIPDMDVVTTAATYRNCHTPNEYLDMDSFEKVYKLLVQTLKNLAKE